MQHLKITKQPNNQYTSSNTSVSAASVSDITGIPRATCIRKLEWLVKSRFVKKNPENKRYRLLHNNLSDSLLNHPLTNIKATTGKFSELSSIVYKSIN